MKTSRRKLRLHRETLCELHHGDLRQAAGGTLSRIGCLTKPFICNVTAFCPRPTVNFCIGTIVAC